MFQKYLIGHLCCLAAREQQRKSMFITCSCVCTDWGTCRLGFWQMYRMSCIIYVRSLSYAQKPDVPSINESLSSKHGGARRRKPNNNKHSFFVTNSSHFGTTDKRTFQDSWQQEAWNSFFFLLPPTVFFTHLDLFIFSWCLPNIRLMRDCLFFFVLKCVPLPGVQFWQGDVESLWGLNKQLWHMGRTYSTASHRSSRGD